MNAGRNDNLGPLIDPTLRSVTLVPDSGIQFMDFEFDALLARKLPFRFYVDSDKKLHPMVGTVEADDEAYTSVMPGEHAAGRVSADDDDLYTVSIARVLETFARHWLPIPFLRQLDGGGGALDEGPSTWARVCFVPAEVEGESDRVVLAFDTEVVERQAGGEYTAPERRDATEPDVVFSFVADPAHCAEFVRQRAWIREWVEDVYTRSRGTSRIDRGEPWAMYVALMHALQAGCRFPAVELADIFSSREFGPGQHVAVDLVLDIGNSRTCGILVEEGPNDSDIGLGQPPVPLEIRDLGRPERVYREPFESRVEFHTAEFGLSLYARKSGRPGQSAFWWPSPVRTGPEALRLLSQTDGREGVSGMSSPKRYVWDQAPRAQEWVSSRGDRPLGLSLPPIGGPIASRLRADGRLRRAGERPEMERLYSRNSLFRMLICELLCHALVQVNGVATRSKRADMDLPRRFRRIFITLPSATPVAEQKRMQKLAREAIDLVWAVMKWTDDDLHAKPKLQMDWDEATCTHLVYLYSELEHRLKKFPKVLFDLYGRGRMVGDRHALRIASIDIGGGTTDLMVIQHELEGDQTIHPNQLFREGWRQAGDDVLKKVIEDCILPCVGRRLRECGVSSPGEMLSRLFSGDAANVTRRQQVQRTLFVNQILIPAALHLLGAHESATFRGASEAVRTTFAEMLADQPYNEEVIGYIGGAVAASAAQPFELLDCEVVMESADLDAVVNGVLGPALVDMCDVVRAYQCDILLLTGRPSALPAVRAIIESQVPLAPNRIVFMYGYRVGSWYPFRSDDLRIRDPKTTAAVGALLCSLCEGRRMGFLMRSSELRMKSTARFIGRMEPNSDQLLAHRVALENIDLDNSTEKNRFSVPMEANFYLGYRQLPIERWVTSHLYHVFYKRPGDVAKMKSPLTVTFERGDAAQDDEEDGQLAMEDFVIVDVSDAAGDNWESAVGMRLQTFRTETESEAGYWLDSGSLQTKNILGEGGTHGR